MRTLLKPLLLPGLIILLLALTATLASRYVSVEWLVRHDQWLRDTIRSKPVTCGIAGYVLYLVASLIPGTAGKSIVLGWFFGLVGGVVIVNGALVSASIVTCVVCRYYLRDAVQSRFGSYLQPLQNRVRDDGAMLLLTLRLAHAPFSLMNYAVGAGTDVSIRTFWWTTQIGLLPGNLVFVYAGTRLPTLEELVLRGPLGLLDGPMIAALAGTVFLPWLVRKAMRQLPSAHRTARQLPSVRMKPHSRQQE